MLNDLKKQWQALPDWLKLMLLCLAVMLPLLGLRPLWLPDEGRYAEVAREMIVSGDWLTPQLNFAPHLTKPPLTYWFIAISMLAFGKTAFAARMVSALALTGTVLLTAGLTRQLGKKNAANPAAVMVLLSPIMFTAGNLVTTDMLLTFWEMLAVYLVWRSYNCQPAGRKWLYLAYAALGLAFLTKGPVGGLVPLLAFVGACLLSRDWRLLRHAGSWRGLIIFAIIGFSWYVVIVLKNQYLFNEFLGKEVIDRVLTNVHHRNNTFLIYPAVLVVGFLPWTVFLFLSLRWFAPWAQLKSRELPVQISFLISWITLPLIFFCLAKSRLPLYILSLFIPMAILTAAWIYPEPRQARSVNRLFLWISARGLKTWGIVAAIALWGVSAGASLVKSDQNLYPLIENLRRVKCESDFRLYANRGNLYTLNFYLEREIIIDDPVKRFLADDGPAFLVLYDPRPSDQHPQALAQKAHLLHRHYDFSLYYRPESGR